MNLDINLVLYITLGLLILVILFFINQRKNVVAMAEIKKLTKDIAKLKKNLFDKDIAIASYQNVKQTSLITSEIQKREILEADISRLKRTIYDTQTIAKEASMIKSDFLSNVRHEIRTPMNSILVFSEILEKELEDKQNATYANNIFNAGHNLLNLLNNIIELSEIEAGDFQISPQGIDTKSFLNEIMTHHKAGATKKGLKFSLNISEGVPESIMVDSTRVKEILNNLIENAIKFTKEGEVTVNVVCSAFSNAKHEADISISVVDTGIGIAKENLEQIFKIFESKNASSAIEYKGTGLGLSINRKLAQLMNGNLEVASQHSLGSTFTLSLKKVEVIVASLTKDVDESTLNFTLIKASTIAVVDDDPLVLEEFTRIFENTSMKIETFPDAREAIAFLQTNTIDYLIINVDILTVDDGAVSKVLAKMISAPVITLIASKLKNIHFHQDGMQPVAHMLKPLKRINVFSVLLKTLNAQKITVNEDQSVAIEAESTLSFDRNRIASDAYFSAQTDEIDKTLAAALKTNDLDMMKKFALCIDEQAKAYNVVTLENFSKKLLEKIEFFEIESIDKMLKEYQIKAREYRRS